MLTPFHSLKGNDKEGYIRMERDKKKTTAVFCHKLIYPKKYFLFYQKLLIHYQKKTNNRLVR